MMGKIRSFFERTLFTDFEPSSEESDKERAYDRLSKGLAAVLEKARQSDVWSLTRHGMVTADSGDATLVWVAEMACDEAISGSALRRRLHEVLNINEGALIMNDAVLIERVRQLQHGRLVSIFDGIATAAEEISREREAAAAEALECPKDSKSADMVVWAIEHPSQQMWLGPGSSGRILQLCRWGPSIFRYNTREAAQGQLERLRAQGVRLDGYKVTEHIEVCSEVAKPFEVPPDNLEDPWDPSKELVDENVRDASGNCRDLLSAWEGDTCRDQIRKLASLLQHSDIKTLNILRDAVAEIRDSQATNRDLREALSLADDAGYTAVFERIDALRSELELLRRQGKDARSGLAAIMSTSEDSDLLHLVGMMRGYVKCQAQQCEFLRNELKDVRAAELPTDCFGG
jgi:hypothetical protein